MITADTLALGQILCLLGVLGMVFGIFFVWFPKRTQAVLLAFPRSRWPGWVLMAINVFWAAWVLHLSLITF